MWEKSLPEEWELCKIGDVCQTTQGVQIPTSEQILHISNGYKRYLYINDFKEETNLKYVKDNYKEKVVTKNELVMANTGSPGAVFRGLDGILSNNLFKISFDNNKILRDYLFFYLSSQGFQNVLQQKMKGGIQKHLGHKTINEQNVPIPLIDIQRKIVNILKKAEKALEKRKEANRLLDELVKSQFIEMFGNPLRNDKSFATKKGKDLFKISNGKVVPNGKRFDGGIPAYGGNGVSWYTDEVLFDRDTIVIGRVGFQSGNVHLAKGPLWITDNAMYISDLYGDNLSLVFLCEMMEQIDFTRYQDAGDLKKVTQKPFIEMSYILPPMPLQSEYISFVSQVDKLKFEMQKSLEEMQNNFNSLMKDAFNGKLKI